ncbi:MAG: TIGR04084 family radical SAM/SPASM domain-containing protein [Candidatus Odinarchaeia archaeon]
MNYFIILTNKCNLNCVYCGGGIQDPSQPTEIQYPLEVLKNFLKRDSELETIHFYGGEPLLRLDLINNLTKSFSNVNFIVQTNGLLLNKMPEDVLSKIHTILVSIDGRPQVTDFYRGKGVYRKVIRNVKEIRDKFKGDIIARMTVSEYTDIYRDVTHLLNLDLFDHIHWQCDFLWDSSPEIRWNTLDLWIKNSYNPGISKLVDLWVKEMRHGRVLGLVPFQGIMKTMIEKRASRLRCGAGLDTFTITTSGKIVPCPIPPMHDEVLGDIYTTYPSDLKDSVRIGGLCLSCEVYSICGGRCLYANKTMLWGVEGFLKVCSTVKHLIKCLENVKNEVEELLNNDIIIWNQINYPQLNNGCEIIP